ncbi:putative nucleoside-diphosphate sugar epimerase (plasmid) [Thermobacillus composti KWC4]|uniref:Putative nucleoside-diphosphate sugar epimerase n=1 Tax=Thermobacillus composti (strain DSM 18247 / JCM 13945 / KWC4) TaxID=717605 RepID=L0EKL1_THECK|nr:NmrA/HSCARG family protein [Thermobacillus composti]AGA60072.1 putative nucleoside-diphosphate sugar epimerase [Thermobacillus composti KWC4]
MNNQKLILVTGATGLQGGAVANEALKQGFKVRILVRDENSTKAQALIQKGAEAVVGNFDDPSSLENAMKNVDAVFSVPISGVDTNETDRERKQAFALIQSAKKVGVEQFVHTSVAATSRYKEFPEWGTGYWFEKYWTDKWDIEEAVRSAGFSYWTIVKPANIMENFITEKYLSSMYPLLKQGEIKTVTFADTPIDHISVEDIASFVCAAFANPEKFNGHNIELAAESISYKKIAEIISEVTGKELKITTLSIEEALEQGIHPLFVKSEQWNNVVGYNVDIDLLKTYDIKLTSFKEFAEKNKDKFKIN